jgi:DNA modification methylase
MDGPSFHLSKGDAVAWLRSLPSESIDLVITDPPYESLEKHRAIGTTTRLKHSKASSNDWFTIFPNSRFHELFVEVHRVLRKNTHFYLYCDPETMFVAKPIAEEVGFKFWKPIIWDKCLGPDTPVWTERGVQRIEDIVPGDRVAIPEGGITEVRATRRTRAPSVQLSLSDGSRVLASTEHRFMLANGQLVEAQALRTGMTLCTRPILSRFTSLADAAHLPRKWIERPPAITVTAVADAGEQDLVDISIIDRDELFLLANGVVTHNCKIGMGYHYRARYECILFFEKGKRKLNDLGVADILQAPRISGGYPAEKPPAVSEVLIKQSTELGQLVIDPFMGSGSVGVAALSTGRSFYGNDLCDEAVQITRDRLVDGGGRELGTLSKAEPSKGQLGLSV